ncbi:MAG: UDP-N-acetylmuramoyl-L-alanine--D-glutamate ligase [Pseudorhodoplanes sp.]|jgi:UDP-N-acetylmuramoylalanine--D-glutamate ligase|nr:UDP-N-acetylmuramoyl-L-alanine--D-glutamate ligase [Pseudorhodoplanes sp.]
MTPVTSFKGRRVAVFGLGSSGLSSAKALMAGGADVLVWDDSEKSREAASRESIPVGDLKDADWKRFDGLVLAPGVPLTHPEPHWTVKRAQQHNVEVIGDVELYFRERAALAPAAPFVAITGTNGKSTTTALIAHVLKSAGRDVQVGGNLGTPILALDPPSDDRFHVIEMSSYQIDLTPSLNPTIGIMLNVTPDHLDRHGTMERYAFIKSRVPGRAKFPVIGIDDDYGREMARNLAATGKGVIRISTKDMPAQGYLAGETHIYRVVGADAEEVADLAGIGSLRGMHNAQNAMAAVAACTALGLDDERIRKGLQSFPGLAHRMEEVGREGNVLFVNDSKATNADSAAKALGSFSNIYWIAGGKPKEGGIAPLAEFFPRVRKAYLIGEAAQDFAETLAGKVPFEIVETLDRAVPQAAADAAKDGGEAVVLLSPACASFDQYRNFEVRGDAFRELVKALPGLVP